MTTRLYVPRDSSALALGADALAAAIEAEAERRGIAIELVRNGSRGLQARAARRGRHGRRPRRLCEPVGRRRPGPVRCKLARRRHASERRRPRRRTALSRAPATPHIRPDRPDRPAVDRRLPAIRRPRRPEERARARRRCRVRNIDRIRAARPRRCSVPRRHQVAHGPASTRHAEVHRLQCGRRRFGHVLRPPAHGMRSVLPDRRDDHRGRRDRRDGRLHLRAQRIPARDRHARSRDRPCTRSRLARRARARLRARVRAARRERRGRVRRGNGAARITRRQARRRACETAAARARRPVRPADRHQQRDHACNGARDLRARRRVLSRLRDGPLARHAAVPAGNIRHGGLVELAFGVTLRELLFDFGGGTASGRPARAAQVGGPLGTCPTTSGTCRSTTKRIGDWRGGRPRRHRAARRHVEPRRAGRIRDEVLCDRVVRQVHAVPDRFDARRRDDRTHPPRRYVGAAGHAAARPVRHDAGRFAVRHGRHDTLPGAVRARPFPRRFRAAAGKPAASGPVKAAA